MLSEKLPGRDYHGAAAHGGIANTKGKNFFRSTMPMLGRALTVHERL
jgi:hypothetical protein